jgi:hypothetical protein
MDVALGAVEARGLAQQRHELSLLNPYRDDRRRLRGFGRRRASLYRAVLQRLLIQGGWGLVTED